MDSDKSDNWKLSHFISIQRTFFFVLIFMSCTIVTFYNKIHYEKSIQSLPKPQGRLCFHNDGDTSSYYLNETHSSTIPKSNRIFAFTRGRFGNILREIATLKGLAHSTGKYPVLINKYTHDDIQGVFPYLNLDIIGSRDCRLPSSIPVINADTSTMEQSMDVVNQVKNTQGDVIVCCHLPSQHFWMDIADDIFHSLTFSKEISDEVYSFLTKVARHRIRLKMSDQTLDRKKGIVFIAVHVRRGDYLREHYRNIGIHVAGKNYFLKAMSFFRQRIPNSAFIVSSDDIPWCKTELSGPDVYFSAGQYPWNDMALLGACNHTIRSIGSYGAWVSRFTGGKQVVYRYDAKEQSQLLRKPVSFFPHAVFMNDEI